MNYTQFEREKKAFGESQKEIKQNRKFVLFHGTEIFGKIQIRQNKMHLTAEKGEENETDKI